MSRFAGRLFVESSPILGQIGRSPVRAVEVPRRRLTETPGQIGQWRTCPKFESPQALDISITVSRAPARALRANSRRFGGRFASPAPLGVHRPTRASGGDPEGVENVEGVEDAVELAKLDRKSPLTRARPRVPAKTRLPYLR